MQFCFTQIKCAHDGVCAPGVVYRFLGGASEHFIQTRVIGVCVYVCECCCCEHCEKYDFSRYKSMVWCFFPLAMFCWFVANCARSRGGLVDCVPLVVGGHCYASRPSHVGRCKNIYTYPFFCACSIGVRACANRRRALTIPRVSACVCVWNACNVYETTATSAGCKTIEGDGRWKAVYSH